MKRFEYKPSVVAILAAIAAWPNAATAADTVSELQTVTVTAEKREQKLIDVPAAVQAFSGEQLERLGVTDLGGVIRLVPGASEGRSTSAATRSFQIRGVTSLYGDSTVGYYLDDAVFTVLNRNWAPVASAFDVERVEVLRGPQGTLYGLGAMGGSVRFITADPDLTQVRARAGAGYSWTSGGDPNWNAEGAVSVPLVKDVVAVRVAAAKEFLGGYAESPTFPGQLSKTSNEMVRLKLLAKPSEGLTIKAGFQQTNTSDDKGNQLEYFPGPVPPEEFTGHYPRSTLGGVPFEPYNNSRTQISSLYLSYDLGPALIESSSGYIKATQANKVPVNGLVLNSGLDASSASSELRLVSKGDGPLRWIGGVMVLDAKSAEDVALEAVTPPPAIPLLGPTYAPLRNGVPTYHSKSWAGFGEVSYDMFDRTLTPLIGLRRFHDNRTFTDNQRPHTKLPIGAPGPCRIPVNPAACFVGASVTETAATFDSWNPRFNLSYRPVAGTTTYFNAAKGFRSGVFNAQSTVTAGFPAAVAPDHVMSYEVGHKTALLGGALVLEAAIYRYFWKEVQLNFNAPGFPPPPPQVVANVGDVRGQGLDYSITWVAGGGLRLTGSGNVNQTKFTNIVNPSAFANTNIYVGNQLSTVPKQTHSITGSWFRPLTDEYTLGVHGSFAYIGQQGDPSSVGSGPFTRPAPLGEAQKLLSLRVGVEVDRWSVYLVGANLANHSAPYYVSGSGYQRNYPRTLGLEVKYEL